VKKPSNKLNDSLGKSSGLSSSYSFLPSFLVSQNHRNSGSGGGAGGEEKIATPESSSGDVQLVIPPSHQTVVDAVSDAFDKQLKQIDNLEHEFSREKKKASRLNPPTTNGHQQITSNPVNINFNLNSNKNQYQRKKVTRIIDDNKKQHKITFDLNKDSILDEGILVPLRPIESTTWGGIDVDVTNSIHLDNLTIAIQSANLFGLNTAGIDIISPDISIPWHQNGGIINEVNFAPLFGGAEISRSYIPQFFSEFIEGEGRIPMEIHETLLDAKKKQHQYIKKEMKCFLVASHETLDANLNQIHFPFDSINKRVKALIYRPDVEAIVIYFG
jgi:hypothetical protein